MKKVYGNAMKVGWILTLIGVVAIFTGFSIGGSTGNTAFFALALLGMLLLISGITTVAVYAGMQRGVSSAFNDSSPLLRFTISARDYVPYVAAQAEEIRSANKISLVIALIFCGLVSVIGPFTVKEDGFIFIFIGIGIGLFLIISAWIITSYRVHKLKNSDKEVILTPGSAYVAGELHLWSVPSTFLSEAVYFGAGDYEMSPLALIRITYNALTRTIVTPYTILIPVPAGMEEKAKAAVEALQSRVLLAEAGKKHT